MLFYYIILQVYHSFVSFNMQLSTCKKSIPGDWHHNCMSAFLAKERLSCVQDDFHCSLNTSLFLFTCVPFFLYFEVRKAVGQATF